MVLEIVKYGDPMLRAKGRRIEPDEQIRQLAKDMIETMYAARGLGLAAQQVGLALQMAVFDVAQVQKDRPSTMAIEGEAVELAEWMPLVLLNPKLELSGPQETASEGCLSFPEINGDIPRAAKVKVQADLLDGGRIHFEATGLLSRALQHETDHLNGVLFIDRMNSATKASIASKLKRMQKETLRSSRKDRQAVAF